MNTQSRTFGCLSAVFFALSALLPIIALAIGWIGWDLQAGSIAGLITFVACFVIGSVLIVGAHPPVWLWVILPAAVGLLYSVVDFIPLPFDDVLVAAAGLMVSMVMAWIQYGGLPRQFLIPLLGAAIYTIIGDVIPTPVDNLLVNFFP
jgi:hypothetical protein